MKRARQLSFLPKTRLEHGGQVRENQRKEVRPLDSKRPLHVVMRASRARGEWSFLHRKNRNKVQQLAYTTGARCGVRIYKFVNVGNHLHFLLKAPSRHELQRFLRILPGVIALAVTQARKGNPIGKFWDKLAYSRVVSWGKDFLSLKGYLEKNILESLGLGRAFQETFDQRLRAILLAGLRPVGPPAVA